MNTYTYRRAFTLVEMLVGISLSFMIIGGLIMTFNAVNLGVKNANRSNDLTQATRNIYQVIQNDITKAGKGLGDLKTLQVHFNHSSASANERYFYGVVGQPALNGHSQIVLQWFDYDVVESPTFLVSNPGGGAIDGAGNWVGNLASADFLTNDPADPELANVQAGDIFVLYNPQINYEIASHRNLRTQIDASNAWLEQLLGNGAMLLQAVAVAQDLGGGKVTVSFGAGSSFDNNIIPLGNPWTNGGVFPQAATQAVTDGLSQYQFRPPSGAWLARKLSDANGYHRVRYFVNGSGSLIRQEESAAPVNIMVLATNVDEFSFEVGTDISDPSDPAQQLDNSWDNAVALDSSGDFWWGSAVSEADINTIGRHAVAAHVRIRVKSLIEDIQDANASGTGDAFKVRVFERHFFFPNMHSPLVSY